MFIFQKNVTIPNSIVTVLWHERKIVSLHDVVYSIRLLYNI